MKRILLLLAIIVVGTLVVSGLGVGYLLWFGTPSVSSPAITSEPLRKIRPLPDVEALAHRMLNKQDVYAKLQDEACAAYAKAHPGVHPYDAEARETLKLASYLLVWGDFYGEGLWLIIKGHAQHLQDEGCTDPVWLSLQDLVWGPNAYSTTELGVTHVNAYANQLGASGYPAAFRLADYEMAMNNMIEAKHDDQVKPQLGTSIAALPDIAGKAVGCYGELVAQHLPTPYIYEKGRNLLNDAKDDEPTLELISKGIDQAWEANDRDNPAADLLDAAFYIDKAWGARGGDYADKVTDEGWKNFGDNEKNADDLLTRLYARAPQQPGLARCMMHVVQGLQMPRDQMERWFQRAIQVDPNDCEAYSMKEWYLLPRWYGTEQDEWAFGMDCAKGGNWSAKIPLIIVDELTYRAQAEPGVYMSDDVWKPLEGIYREYLSRYPDSVHYRSLFALNAAQGDHWDVAKEQFKILGDDWDPEVFPNGLYEKMMLDVKAH
jgi:hypothetical protein